ncbi:MAG TPA: hypothetical protein PK581_09080 [Caldisericia bacterium]|nr:hypothetical protein [Caldisericia bacterium]
MTEPLKNLLKPWMIKPFELLFHAETHRLKGTDYDRRLALVSFDNAIEVSITVYLSLNPIQRQNRTIKRTEVEESLKNYHTKLDFFFLELEIRKMLPKCGKDYIVWYHEQRNEQYHSQSSGVPSLDTIGTIRNIALWIFSVLFSIPDLESLLKSAITESEKSFPEIPKELVTPDITEIWENVSALLSASIIGSWDESTDGDNEIISLLTGDSGKWLNSIREIKKNDDEVILLRNGIWQVKDQFLFLSKLTTSFFDPFLDSIKSIAVKVLSEIHPMFELKPENRFAAQVYGKVSNYSHNIRRGVAQTLAFLGIHGSELKNCTLHKPKTIATSTIREVLNNADWRLWASLNNIMPILAEAAPEEFLSSVENTLKKTPCPFDELYKQEGKGDITGMNYMTGICWALEALAWSEEYLCRIILVLAGLAARDPGGNWGNRPANSITTILLPWMPQTTASIEKRTSSLTSVQKHYPEIAWKIIVSLLPKRHQMSTGSYKPKFRAYVPKDWEKEVSIEEYQLQIKEYTSLAVKMAQENMDHVSELVEYLDNVPEPSFEEFLGFLSSYEILALSDIKKTQIWETLTSFTRKHRRFSNAVWALSPDKIDLLEKASKNLVPSKPELLYKNLFTDKEFELMEPDEHWRKQQERLLIERTEALKNIYKNKQLDSVLKFAQIVEVPGKVGSVFSYIAKKVDELQILPSYLNSGDPIKKQFTRGYIWSKHYREKMNWVESLKIEKWSQDDKLNFLLILPLEKEIWEKAEIILGSNIGEYWKNITNYPFPNQDTLLPAVESLLKNGRPLFALDCIYTHYSSKKELFKEQAVKALIESGSSTELVNDLNVHHIAEILTMLQNDPSTDEDDLCKIEWIYLPILRHQSKAQPKTLEKQLSTNPNFYIEVIQSMYFSKNDKQEKESVRITEQTASNLRKLLTDWKRPPGLMDDGTFSGNALKAWVDKVKELSIESGHLEMAMTHLGRALFYAGSDPNGLWIQKAVAELLDEIDNDSIRKGFRLEIFHSRGVHYVDPSGNAERTIANDWRSKADEVEKIGLIYFSTMLREVAQFYDNEAERVANEHKGEDE